MWMGTPVTDWLEFAGLIVGVGVITLTGLTLATIASDLAYDSNPFDVFVVFWRMLRRDPYPMRGMKRAQP